MLFRNGFKMIFSLRNPGVISIRFNFFGPQNTNSSLAAPTLFANSLMEESLIEARRGAFGNISWTAQGENIQVSSLVRYHLTIFIRESSK
ncbi:MAG: hypothetical protein WCH11_03160 [Bdellovibrio sp.]